MLREEEFEKRERLLERKMSTLEMTASGGVRAKYTDGDDVNEDDGEEDDVGTSGDFELPSTQEEGDLDAEYGGQLADHAKDCAEDGGE